MSEIIEYPSGTATQLGSGYDLLGRTSKFSPLKPVTMITEGRGPDITNLAFVESSYELSQFLRAGMEGAYDSLVFGASTKADFVEDTKINRYSLLFVVHAKAVRNTEIATRPKLSHEALEMIDGGEFIDFRSAFGDYYVSALTRGGELFGMIKIQTKSESEYSELKTKLNASGIGWSTSGNLEKLLAKHVASTRITVKVRVSGISNYTTPTTPSQLFSLVRRFPNKVMAHGSPLKVELKPISDFPEYPKGVSEFDAETRYALWNLSNHYLDYKMLLNNITFMLSSAGNRRFDFDSVSKTQVAEEKQKVLLKLEDLGSLADELISSTILPNDPSVVNFKSACAFEETLTLPNSIEVKNIPDIKIFPLQGHTRGDSDMKGHRPKIYIDAKINGDKRAPVCDIEVKMVEDQKDWTTFQDSAKVTVDDLRYSGFEFAGIHPKTGHIRAQAGKDDHKWHWYSSSDGGLLKRAKCRSDVRGKETGKIGAEVIRFNPVTMLIAPLKRPAPSPVRQSTFNSRRKEMVRYWMHKDPDTGRSSNRGDGNWRPVFSSDRRMGLPVGLSGGPG